MHNTRITIVYIFIRSAHLSLSDAETYKRICLLRDNSILNAMMEKLNAIGYYTG